MMGAVNDEGTVATLSRFNIATPSSLDLRGAQGVAQRGRSRWVFFTPSGVKAQYISPSDAFLPPTREMSSLPMPMSAMASYFIQGGQVLQ